MESKETPLARPTKEATDPAWPPGTVRLELLKEGGDHDIVLLPRPTKDPNDPLNWPRWRKNLNFGLSCFYALMVMANINATLPTWGPMGAELNFSDETLNNCYAIGGAGLALGSPMLIPFALKYGLRPVYVLSSIGQFAVMIWAARTMTAGDWWGVNAMQCWLASLAEVMVQMTVADVFFVHRRGLKNSIYIWVSNTGLLLAPVASGFVTDSQGWRWVWWYLVIIFGIQFLVMFFGFEESKFNSAEILEGRQVSDHGEPVVIAVEKAVVAEVRDEEKHGQDLKSRNVVQVDETIKRKTYLERLKLLSPSPGSFSHFFRHAWQPFVMLFTIPGVAYCSAVYAVLVAWSVVMSAALSTYMLKPPYSFSATAIGLMNLAPFIGTTLGTLICAPLSDWMVLKLAKRGNGIYEPEMRFWLILPFAPFQIAGAWWFGYALQYGQSWLAVAVAFAMANFGAAPISAVALTYITDSYNEIIGDALVSLSLSKNLLSMVWIFAMVPWVDAVGISNVFNTIGAIGAVILLFSIVFIWKGKHWRYLNARRYKFWAERQFNPRPMKN